MCADIAWPRVAVLALGAVAAMGCAPGDPAQAENALTDQAATKWTVNDVSYLFPLPTAEGEDQLLLQMSSAGERGPLLPPELYETHVRARFGGLWEGFGREKGYEWSRVLGLRVDPCAAALDVTSDTTCRNEVRLSVQPLSGGDGEDMTSAIDAAMHLIYEIDQDEMKELTDGLQDLRRAADIDTDDAPLGPHPVMVEEGLDGPFARGIGELILDHVGADNLTKFTVMTRGRNSTNWRFLQLVRSEGDDGTFARAPIVSLGEADIQGVNELGLDGENNSRDTSVSPVDEALGYPKDLWTSVGAMALSKAKVKVALGRLASFEDPAAHSAETLDCASCHVTANARTFFEELTGVKTPKSLVTFKPPAGQNTERVDETKLSGKSLRAFGYLGTDIAISQRTINESARVAAWLSSGGP